jgi:hypothetical protein
MLVISAHSDANMDSLAPRCTEAALDLLQYLQRHPCFLDLVERLETIKGRISLVDVQMAFMDLTMEPIHHA